jgi:biotin operon repressor
MKELLELVLERGKPEVMNKTSGEKFGEHKGGSRTRVEPTPAQMKLMIELRARGLSLAYIAHRVGMSRNWVGNQLQC